MNVSRFRDWKAALVFLSRNLADSNQGRTFWPERKGYEKMFIRFVSGTIVTTWILHSLTLGIISAANIPIQELPPATLVSASALTVSQTPLDLLKQSIEIAKQGDVLGGFTKAKDAKQLGQQQGQFSLMLVVEYLNTLNALHEQAQADQKESLRVEAIATIDQFISQPDFDGKGNPQVAYFFMAAVKQFANAVVLEDTSLYIRLQIQQGAIAKSLTQNPNYPADGKPFLGDSLAGMAIALALQNDLESAKTTLSEACNLGFCELEKLSKLPVLDRVKDRKKLDDHILQLHERYVASLKDWSSKEISQFEGFRFTFHVDNTRGGSLSSRDFEGQVTVIDLWATWCPPCRESLPHFEQLRRDYRKHGVSVLGISMDSPDDPNQSVEKVRDFLTDHKLRFPCGMGTNELKNQLPAELKLPTTLFVDRSGTVRYMTNGYQDYAKVEAITSTLLNEKQPVMVLPSPFYQGQ
jgi:thiol-disulfide isomerase/thioredoxin